MAIRAPPRPRTLFRSMNLTNPLLRASSLDCSVTRVAVPPMWKVRMVSCVPGFAGEYRADLDALDARGLDGVGQLLAYLLVDVHDHVAFVVLDLIERDAAHNAIAQRLDLYARLDDGLDVDAVGSSAVEFTDDDVLRDVYKAPRQVARIGRLERRIGQTFARAVRGDEVLQHGQAFAEVGG